MSTARGIAERTRETGRAPLVPVDAGTPRAGRRDPGSWVLLAGTVVADVALLTVRPQLRGGWSWLPLLAAVGLHLALVERQRRRPTLGTTTVCVAIAMAAAVAVAAPAFGSRDLYSYAFSGRMVAFHHENPYLTAPESFPGDPLLGSVAHVWRGTKTVYGPVFTLISAVGALGYGTSPTLARIYFQAIEACALLAGVALLVKRRVPAHVLLFLGLAPAVLVVVNGGHNDLLTGILLLAGTLALQDRKPWTAGALLGAAVTVKLLIVPGVALVLVAVALGGRRREAWRAASVAVAATMAGYLLVGGPAALRPIADSAQSISRGSLWHGVSRVLRSATDQPGLSGSAARQLAGGDGHGARDDLSVPVPPGRRSKVGGHRGAADLGPGHPVRAAVVLDAPAPRSGAARTPSPLPGVGPGHADAAGVRGPCGRQNGRHSVDRPPSARSCRSSNSRCSPS